MLHSINKTRKVKTLYDLIMHISNHINSINTVITVLEMATI